MNRSQLYLSAAVLLSGLPLGLFGARSEAGPSPNAVAATAHPIATEVARSILDRGGNAADAAVAAGFTLAVVEPSMSHLGGRIQILVRTPEGKYEGYNGMTEVPRSFVAPQEPSRQGYGTIATPGMVAGLARLHREHGSLPWSELITEPARIARTGYRLLPGAAARHARAFDDFAENSGFQQVFVEDDGTAFDSGDLLEQPALGNTLQRLADFGAADFYRGEIARKIAADMAAHGGFVGAKDLAAYAVLDGRYVSTSYRGFGIHTLAAPAGGGLVVKALNILESFDLSNFSDVQWAAVMNQALAITINSRAEDPNETDLEKLASKFWAADQASSISVPEARSRTPMQKAAIALREPSHTDWSGDQWGPDSHHTSHFAVADCSGAVVGITQTLGPLFGSRVITPELGFVYATTMGTYLSEADQAPGSRPRTTIAPTVVTRDGEVVLALGAAGGIRILSAIVQTISRFVDQGHDPQTAVQLPRVHPYRETDDAGARRMRGDKINLEMTPERGWSSDFAQQMGAAGFEVESVERHAAFGRIHLIAGGDDGWLGVADADWEGSTASVSCAAR